MDFKLSPVTFFLMHILLISNQFFFVEHDPEVKTFYTGRHFDKCIRNGYHLVSLLPLWWNQIFYFHEYLDTQVLRYNARKYSLWAYIL